MTFRDRRDAGIRLAARLQHLHDRSPFVVAVPPGGVPVALEIARALEAPHDVLVVRRLGLPWLDVGAVAEGGVTVLDGSLLEATHSDDDLEWVIEAERAEVERRVARYRQGRPLPHLGPATAILVDDGTAVMNGTIRAALSALEGRCRRIVLATPVASRAAVRGLQHDVDLVVVLETPASVGAISTWYEDFAQVSEEEIVVAQRARRA